ncbi:MAG: hybrid sensor histidine kinase/response regulator, partial [Gemmobacter sp.]
MSGRPASQLSGQDRLALAPALTQAARGAGRSVWALLAAATACAVTVALSPDPAIRLPAGMAGVTFCMLVLVLRGIVLVERLRQRRLERDLQALMGHDAAPCFSTDGLGRIGFQNLAANARFGNRDGVTLIAILRDCFASPASVLYRLQSRAQSRGAAREDVVSRHGHIRLSVHRIGRTGFLWRVEEFVDRTGTGRGAETLSLPMLVANKAGVVLFSNVAMRKLLGVRPK